MLVGCAFCDASPDTETGETHTWGQDERITDLIYVDTLVELTRFRVELEYLALVNYPALLARFAGSLRTGPPPTTPDDFPKTPEVDRARMS